MTGKGKPEGMGGEDLAAKVARARAGDREAWGELYSQFAAPLFRFCRRVLPTREDAEDAAMDVFVKLRSKLGQYDPERPFTAWLYKVAANHCWDLLRRRKIRQDLETEDAEALPLKLPDPGQLDQMISEQTGSGVRDALSRISDRARMALVLRYYSEMSYDEIADTLGLRRAFVGVVLLRARHELREAMAQAAGTAPAQNVGTASAGGGK